MRYRKLRSAWSVVWVIACVLLVVFWIVSRGQLDIVCYETTPRATKSATDEGNTFHISPLPHTFDHDTEIWPSTFSNSNLGARFSHRHTCNNPVFRLAKSFQPPHPLVG